MRSIKQLLFLGLICAVFLTGCGGYGSPATMPGTQSAKMNLSATDAPPAGVTVFSFEVTGVSGLADGNTVSALQERAGSCHSCRQGSQTLSTISFLACPVQWRSGATGPRQMSIKQRSVRFLKIAVCASL